MANVSKIQIQSGTYFIKDEAGRSLITSEFSTAANYTIGDYVIYEDLLYRFIVAHPAGEWKGTGKGGDVEQVNVGTELKYVREIATKAFRFIGKSTTEITEGSVTSSSNLPTIDGTQWTLEMLKDGDIVLYDKTYETGTVRTLEFFYTKTSSSQGRWDEVSAGQFGKLAFKDSASGVYKLTSTGSTISAVTGYSPTSKSITAEAEITGFTFSTNEPTVISGSKGVAIEDVIPTKKVITVTNGVPGVTTGTTSVISGISGTKVQMTVPIDPVIKHLNATLEAAPTFTPSTNKAVTGWTGSHTTAKVVKNDLSLVKTGLSATASTSSVTGGSTSVLTGVSSWTASNETVVKNISNVTKHLTASVNNVKYTPGTGTAVTSVSSAGTDTFVKSYPGVTSKLAVTSIVSANGTGSVTGISSNTDVNASLIVSDTTKNIAKAGTAVSVINSASLTGTSTFVTGIGVGETGTSYSANSWMQGATVNEETEELSFFWAGASCANATIGITSGSTSITPAVDNGTVTGISSNTSVTASKIVNATAQTFAIAGSSISVVTGLTTEGSGDTILTGLGTASTGNALTGITSGTGSFDTVGTYSNAEVTLIAGTSGSTGSITYAESVSGSTANVLKGITATWNTTTAYNDALTAAAQTIQLNGSSSVQIPTGVTFTEIDAYTELAQFDKSDFVVTGTVSKPNVILTSGTSGTTGSISFVENVGTTDVSAITAITSTTASVLTGLTLSAPSATVSLTDGTTGNLVVTDVTGSTMVVMTSPEVLTAYKYLTGVTMSAPTITVAVGGSTGTVITELGSPTTETAIKTLTQTDTSITVS